MILWIWPRLNQFQLVLSAKYARQQENLLYPVCNLYQSHCTDEYSLPALPSPLDDELVADALNQTGPVQNTAGQSA